MDPQPIPMPDYSKVNFPTSSKAEFCPMKAKMTLAMKAAMPMQDTSRADVSNEVPSEMA